MDEGIWEPCKGWNYNISLNDTTRWQARNCKYTETGRPEQIKEYDQFDKSVRVAKFLNSPKNVHPNDQTEAARKIFHADSAEVFERQKYLIRLIFTNLQRQLPRLCRTNCRLGFIGRKLFKKTVEAKICGSKKSKSTKQRSGVS